MKLIEDPGLFQHISKRGQVEKLSQKSQNRWIFLKLQTCQAMKIFRHCSRK